MKRLACVAGILFLAGTPAFACPSPLTGKDAAGTTQNFGVTLDGSANCYGNIAIVDGSNAANKATVTAGNALKVDGSAVTQPVSGTVTANQGGAPWSVSQSGNWTARVVGNAGGIFDFVGQNAAQPANAILIGGEFNTTPTTLVSPAASPLQLDFAGNLLVNLKANSFGTLTVTGTVTANQGTSPWTENVSQFGGSAVVTGTGASGAGIPRVTVSNDSNVLATQSGTWTVNQGGTWTVQQGTPPWTIQGDSASGAANAGNPVKAGGVFNTTQPTVTTGQTVDAQSTARGALIVATGIDTFSATVSGTVTANQGGAPWTENITQFGGVNISTGTGASGTGIPRVTVSNDSNILATQSGTWTVQQGTPPWQFVGNVASGATDSGNPVKTGGVFNTTQPTVTTGQRVDAQSTARGATIVATGVDAFAATVSGTVTANQGGTWTVQPGNTANTTPWLVSIAQGGNTAAVNASSQLSVVCANCSGSGVSQVDLTGFAFGSTVMVPVGGVFSTTPSPIPSGQAGAARLTANRAIQQNQVNSAGQELGANLPGANNVAVQVNQANTFQPYRQPGLFPTGLDVEGNQFRGAVISDGTHFADVVGGNQTTIGSTNGGLVVVPSPKVSLQCPFTVGINQTASTQIVTNPGGKALHICLWNPISASAQNISLVEGTGSTCGTGMTALWGGTTASVAVAANGGAALVSDRIILPMQKPGDNLCVLQSAAGNVSGTLTYGVF